MDIPVISEIFRYLEQVAISIAHLWEIITATLLD